MSATKEQERKVLEQIRKMVEELGTDSYIAMAFEGCFEIAESNIDNDFGCSMKQRAESAERKVETAVQGEKAAEKDRDYFQKEASRLSWIVEELEEEKRNLAKEQREMGEKYSETVSKCKEQQERADRLEDENIRLKAKLYDLICK